MALFIPALFFAMCCPSVFGAAAINFAKSVPSLSTPSFAATTTAFQPSFASTPFSPVTSFASPWIKTGLPISTFGAPKPFTSASARVVDAATLAKLVNDDDLPLLNKPGLDATEALYDQGSFRNWNIQMSQKDIDGMNSNPTAEKKFPCTLTSAYGSRTAKTFSMPGISCRYKGSVGSLRMCVDENNRFNGDCRKLSWAVDVEGIKQPKPVGNTTKKVVPEATIHGAKNFIFGGCPVDWSMMSERMAYSLLNAVNVTAPVASHAKLFLNGKYLGVYSFVQPADTTFARERFLGDKNRGKGALYKEVWLNQLGMRNLAEERKGGTPADDIYMRTILATIDATPLTTEAATKFLEKYFDTKAFIDVTAVNAVIGATDDWRQRHNFLWYVRDGSSGKKVVLLPWDYDRLYDERALTRGALAGNPWWDIQATATPARCNAAIESPEQLAAEAAESRSEIARWTSIFKTLPPDGQIPVTCDKFTKLLSLAFGAKVRARTKEFLNLITVEQIRAWFATWNAQIEGALAYDMDGPASLKMRAEQNRLMSHLYEARAVALQQINQAEGSYSSSSVIARPTVMFRSG
jgi:hypothetical protein